jgi:hypothetical protein
VNPPLLYQQEEENSDLGTSSPRNQHYIAVPLAVPVSPLESALRPRRLVVLG